MFFECLLTLRKSCSLITAVSFLYFGFVVKSGVLAVIFIVKALCLTVFHRSLFFALLIVFQFVFGVLSTTFITLVITFFGMLHGDGCLFTDGKWVFTRSTTRIRADSTANGTGCCTPVASYKHFWLSFLTSNRVLTFGYKDESLFFI